jgi:hypothetical protein
MRGHRRIQLGLAGLVVMRGECPSLVSTGAEDVLDAGVVDAVGGVGVDAVGGVGALARQPLVPAGRFVAHSE